jgi:hypothetical protein
MWWHTECNNLVISAVLLKFSRAVALMTVKNEQLVHANSTLLCIRVKVLNLRNTKLIICLSILRYCYNLLTQ